MGSGFRVGGPWSSKRFGLFRAMVGLEVREFGVSGTSGLLAISQDRFSVEGLGFRCRVLGSGVLMAQGLRFWKLYLVQFEGFRVPA